MQCCAWKSWHLEGDKMVTDRTCKNEAEYLLSSPPHWENKPYCAVCAGWMMAVSGMANRELIIEALNKEAK